MTMRLRFAPSPTGYLHIGGARTALFNWLLARKNGGVFLLRIEDTDRKRSKPEFEEQILRDMAWMGLDWDEGPSKGGEYGPYRQTERQGRYDQYVESMLAGGKAYRCTCSKERLTEVREAARAKGDKPKYDGHCRALNLGPDCGEHVIRFAAPQTGETVVADLVKGDVRFNNEELDDLIIQRSDGTPTYNLVVVIDDHEMAVTHVIRGDDHLNNTPKQQMLYEALGFPVPKFAHLPIILGNDGGKMSKRHGDTSVGAYREKGFLPQALLNYLTRLGWACGDMEQFSAEEAIAAFSLDGVAKAGAKWDMDKLSWLNQQWIIAMDTAELSEVALPYFAAAGVETDERLEAVVGTVQARAKTLVDLVDAARFYFTPDDELTWDEKAITKFLKPATGPLLTALADVLDAAPEWRAGALEPIVKEFCEAREVGLGKVAQPIRVSMTGQKTGPGLYEMLEAAGKPMSLRRIRAGAARCPQDVS
jgi:glutamyl-tRNA synthetase